MADTQHTRVLIGEFGRAHGVRGEVRLKSYTAEPAAIATYKPLQREDGSAVVLLGVRPVGKAPDMFVARVEGIASREAAEALTRERLYITREQLQVELEEDEFLQADIIGARVEDAAGQAIGRLVAFHDFGGGDVVEIAPAPGVSSRRVTVMVPFTRAFVPVVDVAGGRIVVTADGLFSDDDEPASQ